jgi:hypothetical protein
MTPAFEAPAPKKLKDSYDVEVASSSRSEDE